MKIVIIFITKQPITTQLYYMLNLKSTWKRVYYRVTTPFTKKPLLAEAPYTYHDWYR